MDSPIVSIGDERARPSPIYAQKAIDFERGGEGSPEELDRRISTGSSTEFVSTTITGDFEYEVM